MTLRNREASSGDSSCFLRVGGMLILRMRLKSLDAHRTFCGLSHHGMSGYVKIFGCRPFTEACRRAETGPAFENLQGRKPRVGRAPIRRTRYGDLRVASVCWRVVSMTIKDDFEG